MTSRQTTPSSIAEAWQSLRRIFGIALDIRKLLLGGLALLMLATGHWGLARLQPDQTEAEIGVPSLEDLSTAPSFEDEVWPWGAEGRFGVLPIDNRDSLLDPQILTQRAQQQIVDWPLVLQPLNSFWAPGTTIIKEDGDWAQSLIAWLQLLWSLIVWSFFGTALCRLAAVQFALDERTGLRSACRFALGRFLWVVSAPGLALCFIAGLWGILFLGGFAGRLAFAGPVLVGVLWVVALLLAVAMLLLLAGLALGWPLMVATIGTQGSEGFDGFSRAFDYLYSRPLHYFAFAITCIFLGVASVLIVSYVAAVVAQLAEWPVSTGMGAKAFSSLKAVLPTILGGQGEAPSSLASGALFFWMNLFALMMAGFIPSFFWSAVTAVYFLLRRSVDGIEIEEVWQPEVTEQPQDSLVQLAGLAASDQPAIERPPHGDAPGPQQPQDLASQTAAEAEPPSAPETDEHAVESDETSSE